MNLPNQNNMNMNNIYLNINANNQNMGLNNNNNNNNNNNINNMNNANKKTPFSVIKNDNPSGNMNPMMQMNNNVQPSYNGKRTFETMAQNYSGADLLSGNSHLNQFNPMANDSTQIAFNPQKKTNKEFQGIGGEDRSAEQEKKVQQMLKDYDGNNFKYTSDSFTYQANQFLKKIASENHAQKIASKYPLFKMLRSIVKKFLFNELEIVFFAYILRENQWKIDDERIKLCAPKVKDFMNQNELHDHNEYLQLLLYLILNAYAVKYYLNDMAEMEMYEAHIQTIVPDFANLFSYWSKKFATTSLKINPKVLNKVFQNLSVKSTDNSKKIHEDYNQLVDNIIQISPPYNNSDKQGEQNVTKRDQNTNNSANGSSTNTTAAGSKSGTGNQANQQSITFLNNLYFKKIQEQQQQQQQQQQQTSQNQQNNSSNQIMSNLTNGLGGNGNNQGHNNPLNTNNSGIGNIGNNNNNNINNNNNNNNNNNQNINMNNNYQQPINSQNQQNQQYSSVNPSYFGHNDYLGINTAPDSFKELRFNQQQKNGYDPFNSLALENNFDSQKSQIDQLPILKNQSSFTPIQNIDKIIDSSGANNIQNQFNRFSTSNIFSSTSGSLMNNLGTSQFPTSGNQFNLGNNSNFQNPLMQQSGFSGIGNDFHMNKQSIIVPKPNKIGGPADGFMGHGHKLEDDGNLQSALVASNFQSQDILNNTKKIQSQTSAFLHHHEN